jgi:tight adherence protein C
MPDPLRLALLATVFLIVVVAVVTVSGLLSARSSVRRRFQPRGGGSVSGMSEQSLRQGDGQSPWLVLVNLLEKRGVSLSDTKDERLRARLIAAGYDSPAAPKVFTLVRLLLTLGFPIAYLLLSYSSGSVGSPLKLYAIGSLLALVGLYLPNLILSAKADRRKQQLVNAFPDALDLMLVCVEAGLGLEAAFSKVGSEMTRSHPLMAKMLATLVLELRAGRSREDALRRMAERVQVDEIRAFATLLIQSSKLGSSIGQTLRVYATEMREQRRMRAEEKAHRLPVLLSIPLVAFLLPVMIGVLMLPAMIRVMRQIFPAMGG